MRLSQPFIQLPFQFDAECLAAEVMQLGECWMPHPSGMVGNSAVPLVSANGGDNNDFSGRMQASRHLAHLPFHRQVMGSLGEALLMMRIVRGRKSLALLVINQETEVQQSQLPLKPSLCGRFRKCEDDLHFVLP